MIAKLGDFSEISKLTNVKNHIGRDIFHLFGLFRLSQTLRRLGMVKQCGHSASEVIQAMCMFKVLGETICSMYSPKFNNLLAVGKNCFYRMLGRSGMDWRRLLAAMAIHLVAIFRRNGVDFYKGVTCFILDDSTLAKTTTNGEFVSRVFDHVLSKCVLGYKLQILCVSDGVTTIPIDFSIHREKGSKGDFGLTASQRKSQYKKSRAKDAPERERASEADQSKIDVAISMLRRAWRNGIRPQYILADSWYLCEKLLRASADIGGDALRYLGMGKMDKTRYKVQGRWHNALELVALHEREHMHECRRYHCLYIALNGEYTHTGIPVRIFLVKYGHNKTWTSLVTTDTRMTFVKAFETYQIRWSIEVLIKDCRQNLGLGRCQSNDFDCQVADITITLMAYDVAALDLRFSEYETMGELFASMAGELMKLSLWNVLLECLERMLKGIAEICGWGLEDIMRNLLADDDTAEEMAFLVNALDDYRRRKAAS